MRRRSLLYHLIASFFKNQTSPFFYHAACVRVKKDKTGLRLSKNRSLKGQLRVTKLRSTRDRKQTLRGK
jgi:hypothetical protein